MGRGKNNKLRAITIPAISTISLIFGSALLSLAILSFISARALDNETYQHHSTPLPSLFPKPLMPAQGKLADLITQFTNLTIDPVEELRVLRSVPAEWDVGRPDLWEAENADWFYGCSEPSQNYISGPTLEPNGFLYIEASGGLNQQRTGITDAVVVAKLLNATLVVPELDHQSFWKDKSNFSDIFDVDWFISSVSKDIKVIKEPPKEILSKAAFGVRVPRKAKPIYYLSKILPILKKREVIRLTRFDYRLSNKLKKDWQKLRCRTNYKALQFTKAIQDIGQTLVDRMRKKSGGRFIALHLRYEPDMLAFSGCYYGGGDQERVELGALRRRWKTLHHHNPERARRNGKCPLTPKEVGLMLRALGYGNDTYLYVASGEVYNANVSLAPLKALFPNFVTKETLTKKKELKPFRKFSSRMAAIDYVVCSQSDVFVTNNNGNMARILAGERRYNGHKRTIRPNTKKLNHVFPMFETSPWEEFATLVRKHQKGFMGDPNEVKIGRGEFHEHPLVCICARPGAPGPFDSWTHQGVPGKLVEVENVEDDTLDTVEEVEGEGNNKEDDDDLPEMIEILPEENSGAEKNDAGELQTIALEDLNSDGTYDNTKE